LIDGLRGVLLSDEFRNRSTDLLLDAFPEIARDLFIHIPKTDGITITDHLANHPQSITLYSTESLSTGWIKDWKGYLANMSEKLVNRAQRICVTGHLKADYVLQHNLNRETDAVFCAVREPVALIVSWVNYIITAIARESGIAHPSDQIAAWRDALEIDAH
jgi:hypothetical protein